MASESPTTTTTTTTTLKCPHCKLYNSWDHLKLISSKKTYGCAHCQTVFCLICKQQSSTAKDDHPVPSTCQKHCLLDSTHPGALLTLLLFHETLVQLKGLLETRNNFASLKEQDGLDSPKLKLLKGVENAIEETEEHVRDVRMTANDLYEMMVTMGEDFKRKSEPRTPARLPVQGLQDYM